MSIFTAPMTIFALSFGCLSSSCFVVRQWFNLSYESDCCRLSITALCSHRDAIIRVHLHVSYAYLCITAHTKQSCYIRVIRHTSRPNIPNDSDGKPPASITVCTNPLRGTCAIDSVPVFWDSIAPGSSFSSALLFTHYAHSLNWHEFRIFMKNKKNTDRHLIRIFV